MAINKKIQKGKTGTKNNINASIKLSIPSSSNSDCAKALVMQVIILHPY